MSRHLFLCPPDSGYYYVMMGWDRPLSRYFMVITQWPEQDEPLYSNLSDHTPHQTLTYYVSLLDYRYGLSLPPQMIDEIQADKVHNMGNKDVVHQIVDGRYHRRLGFGTIAL